MNPPINFLKKILDKLYVKQWNIGLTRMTFDELLNDGLEKCTIQWMPNTNIFQLRADPFIVKNDNGHYHILYEDFCYHNNYGTISVAEYDINLNFVQNKADILDTGSHLSYPFIWKDGNKYFIIPEGSKSNQLNAYQWQSGNDKLCFSGTLMKDVQLLDPTIFFWEGKYWLFATKRGKNSNAHLYLYHAENWCGPYQEHAQSPVKLDQASSRPAGGIVLHKGKLYRPSMNCEKYYGKSIVLNRIITLNEQEFKEEAQKELFIPAKYQYSYAIHTINFTDDVIVIDGLRRIFHPWAQIRIFISKWRKKE